jgi:hypothetical protein
MVSVHTTGQKVRGFKPGRGEEFLRTIKNPQHAFFRTGVKPSAPRRKISRHVKELYEYENIHFIEQINNLLHPDPPD